VSTVASNAKVPLIAGGAAIAGLAGGLALLNRGRGGSRKNGALDLDAIASAAQRLSQFGDQVSQIAGAMSEGSKK
jgi:hypothetical protein